MTRSSALPSSLLSIVIAPRDGGRTARTTTGAKAVFADLVAPGATGVPAATRPAAPTAVNADRPAAPLVVAATILAPSVATVQPGTDPDIHPPTTGQAALAMSKTLVHGPDETAVSGSPAPSLAPALPTDIGQHPAAPGKTLPAAPASTPAPVAGAPAKTALAEDAVSVASPAPSDHDPIATEPTPELAQPVPDKGMPVDPGVTSLAPGPAASPDVTSPPTTQAAIALPAATRPVVQADGAQTVAPTVLLQAAPSSGPVPAAARVVPITTAIATPVVSNTVTIPTQPTAPDQPVAAAPPNPGAAPVSDPRLPDPASAPPPVRPSPAGVPTQAAAARPLADAPRATGNETTAVVPEPPTIGTGPAIANPTRIPSPTPPPVPTGAKPLDVRAAADMPSTPIGLAPILGTPVATPVGAPVTARHRFETIAKADRTDATTAKPAADADAAFDASTTVTAPAMPSPITTPTGVAMLPVAPPAIPTGVGTITNAPTGASAIPAAVSAPHDTSAGRQTAPLRAGGAAIAGKRPVVAATAGSVQGDPLPASAPSSDRPTTAPTGAPTGARPLTPAAIDPSTVAQGVPAGPAPPTVVTVTAIGPAPISAADGGVPPPVAATAPAGGGDARNAAALIAPASGSVAVAPDAPRASGVAGRVFAAALHAAAAPAGDGTATAATKGQDAPDPMVAALLATAAPPQPTAATDVTTTAIDLHHAAWPAQMAERIEALRDGADATSTRIRISPDTLGPVDLQVRRDGDRLHVHFTAASHETRTLIADAQPQLAAAAADRGLKLGQTSVGPGELGAGSEGGSAGGSGPGTNAGANGQPGGNPSARQSATPARAGAGTTTSTIATADEAGTDNRIA